MDKLNNYLIYTHISLDFFFPSSCTNQFLFTSFRLSLVMVRTKLNEVMDELRGIACGEGKLKGDFRGFLWVWRCRRRKSI